MLRKGKYIIIFLGILICGFIAIAVLGQGNVSDRKLENTEKTSSIVSDNTSIFDSFEFDIKGIPAYASEPYVELNNNIPLFTEEEKTCDSFEKYTELDELGRCGVAYANICQELFPIEERGSIGNIKPTGWHTVKYNDLIDGNYLYNRCHLIAYCLAGENDNHLNLITGTRYLNVQGMQPFETKVLEYVESTNNHVLYRATPIFEGDNLVASGVTIEAFSVEDMGVGVCFYVYLYNVQPGITIDYSSGESYRTEGAKSDAIIEESSNDTKYEIEYNYVLNTNTKRFHYADCDSVNDMKEKNKKYFSGDREELIEMNYKPCQRCNP